MHQRALLTAGESLSTNMLSCEVRVYKQTSNLFTGTMYNQAYVNFLPQRLYFIPPVSFFGSKRNSAPLFFER